MPLDNSEQQGDQDDDGNGDTEEKQQQRLHGKLLESREGVQGSGAIALAATERRGQAGEEGTDQQRDEQP